MKGFIEIAARTKTLGRNGITLNTISISSIESVTQTKEGCDVYLKGSSAPFSVTQSYTEVLKLIQDAQK